MLFRTHVFSPSPVFALFICLCVCVFETGSCIAQTSLRLAEGVLELCILLLQIHPHSGIVILRLLSWLRSLFLEHLLGAGGFDLL